MMGSARYRSCVRIGSHLSILLCGCALLFAACEPVRRQTFALVDHGDVGKQPAVGDSSVADANADRSDGSFHLADGAVSDGNVAGEDASLVDGQVGPGDPAHACPIGRFEGAFECERTGGTDRLVGSIEFTLTGTSDGQSQSAIMNAVTTVQVPASPDDPTPVLPWFPTSLIGTLYCEPTMPAWISLRFAAPFSELVQAWNLPEPMVDESLQANFTATYDETNQRFTGNVVTTPDPACRGNVIMARSATQGL